MRVRSLCRNRTPYSVGQEVIGSGTQVDVSVDTDSLVMQANRERMKTSMIVSQDTDAPIGVCVGCPGAGEDVSRSDQRSWRQDRPELDWVAPSLSSYPS